MQPQPTLDTERLVLRPMTLADAGRVQELAGDPRIAATTKNIPHPYHDGIAEHWIRTHETAWQKREEASYAICVKSENNQLIGCVSLIIKKQDNHAVLGYWIGTAYWNKGYCTEAAAKLIEFAFQTLMLHRVYAQYLSRNPGSGRVMQKIGMHYEGRFRQHFLKNSQYEDIEQYGILASDRSDSEE